MTTATLFDEVQSIFPNAESAHGWGLQAAQLEWGDALILVTQGSVLSPQGLVHKYGFDIGIYVLSDLKDTPAGEFVLVEHVARENVVEILDTLTDLDDDPDYAELAEKSFAAAAMTFAVETYEGQRHSL